MSMGAFQIEWLNRASKLLFWTILGLSLAIGLAIRLWFLTHQTTTSDNDVVGLMAQAILHGHFSAFYWGQSYGGGVEPYFVAAIFGLFGQSSIVLSVVSTFFSGVAAIITWRVLRRIHVSERLAIAGGALVWVFPQMSIWNSTRELGFHQSLIVFGLLSILMSLRMLDGRLGIVDFALLGIVTGIGWWTSPEIVYFLVPAGLLVIGAIVLGLRTTRSASLWTKRVGVGVVAFAIGSLPWLWANVGSGFVSLRTSTLQVPPGAPGYFGRLSNFYTASFPMQFDLRQPPTGAWAKGAVFTGAVAVLIGLCCVGLLVLSARKGGRNVALIVGVVAFPFVQAILPATWSWIDGRYTEPFFYLLVIATLPGLYEGRALVNSVIEASTPAYNWISTGAICLLVLVASVTTMYGFNRFRSLVDPINFSYLSGWTSPDNGATGTVLALERSGITSAYADYWVAYKLDFLSDGRLHVTDIRPDPLRSVAENNWVTSSADPAWIFVPVTHLAGYQFHSPEIAAPPGWSFTTFVKALAELGIHYKVFHDQLAVVVQPDSRVTPGVVRAYAPQGA